MSVDCFFFLYINRPCIQIRFGYAEGFFYFPEVVISVVYLQGVHIQLWCYQKIITCIFQIIIDFCLVDFNPWLDVFSIFICADDPYIFGWIAKILPCHLFICSIVGGFIHHFHDFSFLLLGKRRVVGNDAFFFYAKGGYVFLASLRIQFLEFIRESIHTGL